MKDIRAKFEPFEKRFNSTRKGRAAFGLSASALVELAIFFAIAFIIDFLVFGGTRFQGLQPHPFWIPVILLSVQYGTSEGLLAAVISTIALLLGALPEQRFGQDIYDYLQAVAVEPLMWFIAAIIVGELAMRRRRRLARTEQELADVRQEADGLAEAYAKARQAKDTLEARLASDLTTTLSLYQGARAVERSSVGNVLTGAVELIRRVLDPDMFSIYLLNGSQLEAAVQEGWEDDAKQARVFAADSALYQAIAAEERMLCAAHADDARILTGEGVLAAPLLGGPSGQPVGMLKIEALSFADLTTSSVETFRLCSEWIGSALERARRQEALAAGQVTAGGGATLSAALYSHEVDLMTRLGARFGFDVAQLVVDAELAHALSADDKRGFATALAAAAKEALRDTDLTFDMGRHGRQYAILLPGADAESADIAARRLEAALSRLAPAAATAGRVAVRAETLELAA
jgi:polysaccharide biosynthesis protein PelD